MVTTESSDSAARPAERASWLCPDLRDRERLLDMDRRLKPVRTIAYGIIVATLLLSIPWFGWEIVIPVAMAIAGFRAADFAAARSERPENWIAAAWVVSATAIAATAAMTGGVESPMIWGLLIPAITLPARFSTRGVVAGTLFTALLMIAVAFGVTAGHTIDDPPDMLVPLGTLAAVIVLSLALRGSDVEHRAEAVIDALTGMLNRKALATRAAELAEQARITGQPVAVIVCDIDHFKRINDEHGHAVGDGVLQELAYRIRKELRAYDLAYRLGGEEFAILLPGGDVRHAEAVAGRLRGAIAAAPICDIGVTMSFGVHATDGHEFDIHELLGKADAALYRAKRMGRNRVKTWERQSDPALTLSV